MRALKSSPISAINSAIHAVINVQTQAIQRLTLLSLALLATLYLTGCGTLTGIPAHGGGKRFATEQRLVSASIRASLKDIDVTPLKGKRAALVFDIVADEGGGNMSGGRISPGLLFSIGTMASPTTTTSSAFQVYNLADGGSSYNNTSSGSNNNASTVTITNTAGSNSGTNAQNGSNTGTSSGTNTQNGTNSGTNTQNGTSSGTNTNTGTSSGTNTQNGTSSGTNTSTGSNTGTNTSTTNGSNTNAETNNSTGTNNTTTGGITSTGGFSQTGGSNSNGTNTSTTTGSNSGTNSSSGSNTGSNSSTGTNTGSNSSTGTNTGTNSSTGSNTGTSSSSGSNTASNSGTNTSTGTNTGTNNATSTATSSQTGGSDGYSNSQGGYNNTRQTLSPTASSTTSKTEGRHSDKTATLQYKGLGEYVNMAVPKSDASLLMGLVRNYLLFNGIIPTVPTDKDADVLVYVTVDIFGTVRSRFDALLYNNETLKAETSFEVSAFDKTGKMILSPRVANREAQYTEHYLLWTGPLTTKERVLPGQGLLVDFTDVDGSKANYNEGKGNKEVNHPFGKN